MRRREFIAGLVGAAVYPVAARAQPLSLPVIGFLGGATAKAYEQRLIPFLQSLKEAGFVEGENIRIEYRWSGDSYERLPALAAELVHLPATVIIAAGGAQTALAAKAATTKIPIVFQNGSDPVKVGLVASISRPAGNATGVTNVSVETASKRFELMRELLPSVDVIGFLQNPRNPNTPVIVKDIQTAASALGRNVVILDFANMADLDKAFATLAQRGIKALVITADPIASNWRNEIIERAARHAIPTMYPYRDFVEAGGLISYGANFSDVYRQVGTYTARILNGESPSELPVVQSTKFELVVNNKTARALALEVPLSLLMRIDTVID